MKKLLLLSLAILSSALTHAAAEPAGAVIRKALFTKYHKGIDVDENEIIKAADAYGTKIYILPNLEAYIETNPGVFRHWKPNYDSTDLVLGKSGSWRVVKIGLAFEFFKIA